MSSTFSVCMESVTVKNTSAYLPIIIALMKTTMSSIQSKNNLKKHLKKSEKTQNAACFVLIGMMTSHLSLLGTVLMMTIHV